MGKNAGFERPFTGGLNKGLSQPPPRFKPVEKSIPPANTGSGSAADLIVGSNVIHDRFGKGKVTKMEGDGPDKKATIFFPHHGAKTVLLRFANLTIVED